MTGKKRGELKGTLNNATGYGEQISLSYQKSHGAGSFEYKAINAKIPVGYSGLNVSVGYSDLDYKAGKEFESLDSKGSANQWTTAIEYPVIRQRKTNVYINGVYNYKKLQDQSSGAQTNYRILDVLSAGISANHTDTVLGGGYTQGSVNVTVGDLDLSGLQTSFDADQAATGAKTHGTFRKVDFNARRTQFLTKDFQFISNISGQIASKNLSSSEKMQLGGVYGVRAYPGGEASGDYGVLVNLEGRYRLHENTLFGNLDLSGFYDWGRIRLYEDADNLGLTTKNIYSLSGIGFGLTLRKPGFFDAGFTLARKIGSNPGADVTTGKDSDGSNDLYRVLFTVSSDF